MPDADVTAGLVWELVSKTALVVVLLYCVLWAVKKLSSKSRLTPGGAGIQVLHSVHLGPGRSVHLLSVGNQTLLVGATSHQVSFLTEVNCEDGQNLQQDSEDQPFARYLGQATETLKSLPARLRRS